MSPCYAITDAIWAFPQDWGSLLPPPPPPPPPPRVCVAASERLHLHNGRPAAFVCENFIAALLCPTGGSILLQTRRDKEETGIGGHCCPGSCPAIAEWQLPLTSSSRAHSWSWPWVPWPCKYPEAGEAGAVKSHTSPCSQRGVSPPAAGPQGPWLHTLLLISSISGRNWPLVDVGSFFSPLLSRAPLKSCVSVSLWLERVR